MEALQEILKEQSIKNFQIKKNESILTKMKNEALGLAHLPRVCISEAPGLSGDELLAASITASLLNLCGSVHGVSLHFIVVCTPLFQQHHNIMLIF